MAQICCTHDGSLDKSSLVWILKNQKYIWSYM